MPASTAIFSPSVARQAASTAKDWNYVDSWLSTKYHGRTPPPFERNPDTLKALLALAALNETADEERELLARVEAAALHECHTTGGSSNHPAAGAPAPGADDDDDDDDAAAPTLERVRAGVLTAVDAALPREGRAALDALAATAAALGVAYPTAAALGRAVVELQAAAGELEQAGARVAVLGRHVAAEAARARARRADAAGPDYRPPADLARQNLEMQRRLKAGAAGMPEAKDRAGPGMETAWMPEVTIEEVREREDEYLSRMLPPPHLPSPLLRLHCLPSPSAMQDLFADTLVSAPYPVVSQKNELEAQVNAFQGLPPDRNLARQELESLRAELRTITRRRDAVFEGLVERETPRKGA